MVLRQELNGSQAPIIGEETNNQSSIEMLTTQKLQEALCGFIKQSLTTPEKEQEVGFLKKTRNKFIFRRS